MANKHATGLHIVAQFNRAATLDVQVKVMEFQERFQVDWSQFRQALLDEYMLDDRTRVTMKTVEEWTEKGGESLLVLELLR